MIHVGSKVSWMVGAEQHVGVVQAIFFEVVTQTICETEITCLGTKQNPAYLVTSEDGSANLILKSEVRLESQE